MKKFYLILAFLVTLGASLLFGLGTTQHASAQAVYTPGTYYYTFSSLYTVGSGAGTIDATHSQGGYTMHLNADGTFTGSIAPNSVSRPTPAGGSFQPDGSIQLTIPFGLGTSWNGTAQPHTLFKHSEYIGTFAVSFAGVTHSSGTWALVPVEDPTTVLAIQGGAIVTAGPSQGTIYGGVIILDKTTLLGTFRLQNGLVVPVAAQISPDAISFTFILGKNLSVSATGGPNTTGTAPAYAYIGTFVGPKSGDSGNWRATPLTFAP